MALLRVLQTGASGAAMIRLRLTLAYYLDRWVPRLKRLAEVHGWPQAWFQEFLAYIGDPRMTLEEFWVRYTLKRQAAQWDIKAVSTEEQAREFYVESDYMLWRNLVHRRHSTWWRVLETMDAPQGFMLEFGCGIAPVSSWIRRRRPDWRYCVVDVEGSPHCDYAYWRFPHRLYWSSAYAVITALDVFEHLSDPEKTARDLVDRLAVGGYLHWNFVATTRNDLDLATEAQREATVKYLEGALELVWERDGYRVSRKRG